MRDRTGKPVTRRLNNAWDTWMAIHGHSISVYVDHERSRSEVKFAVTRWLMYTAEAVSPQTELLGHTSRSEELFRRMVATLKRVIRTPFGREAILTATHVADTRLVQAQDAHVTATLLQSVGPVLGALQPYKSAVVRAGALLIVKIDWDVQVHQLTAAQQAILDHRPQLATSPEEIITALQLRDPQRQESGSAPSPAPGPTRGDEIIYYDEDDL